MHSTIKDSTAKDSPVKDTTVNAVMARSPISVSPETTVPDAVKLLGAHGIRRLPVLDGPRLVGIVTDRDLK
jgi:acetoin utilization protein AcuB